MITTAATSTLMTGAPLLLGLTTMLTMFAVAASLSSGSRRTLAPAGAATAAQRRVAFVSRRRLDRILDDAYPDLLDLFVVSVQAGLLPVEAFVRIRPHVHPCIATAIDDVVDRMRQGGRLVDAMDALVAALGTRALSFVATVALAERTGLAIGPMIDRIGDDARLHRRRRAESAARELPVRLSFPLVLCTLPSFVLISIAPLLIGALSSLRGT